MLVVVLEQVPDPLGVTRARARDEQPVGGLPVAAGPILLMLEHDPAETQVTRGYVPTGRTVVTARPDRPPAAP